MKKTMIPKGLLKTIRFVDAPVIPTQKRRKKVVTMEKTAGVEVTVGALTHRGTMVQIEGHCTLIASTDGPRVETYAEVTLQENKPEFKVFIVTSQDAHHQVIAIDEDEARHMHPSFEFEWDEHMQKWRDDKGELVSDDHYWPSPEELVVQQIGTDEYAEVAERLHFWEA